MNNKNIKIISNILGEIIKVAVPIIFKVIAENIDAKDKANS